MVRMSGKKEKQEGKGGDENQDKPGSLGEGSSVLIRIRKWVLICSLATLAFGGVLVYSEDAASLLYSIIGSFSEDRPVGTLVKGERVVADFLSEHPDASMDISFFRREEATMIFEYMEEQCNQSTDLPEEFYRVTIESGRKSLTAWVDWSKEEIVCVARTGDWSINCSPHANFSCYGGDVYWFDSCGRAEEIKKSCFGRCKGQECLELCVLENSGFAIEENISCCSGLEVIPDINPIYGGCEEPDNETFLCTMCGDGLCKLPENMCSCPVDCDHTCDDTDGVDYYEWGKVVRDGIVSKDRCLNQATVLEYFCEHMAVMNETFECPHDYECHSGRCVNVSLPCVTNGETYMELPGYRCCDGLTQVQPTDPNNFCEVGVPHVFICINCSNGICGQGENGCNCPEDCGEPY